MAISAVDNQGGYEAPLIEKLGSIESVTNKEANYDDNSGLGDPPVSG